MRIALLISLLFCTTIVSISQDYDIKRLGIENGLSNNYVVSITQDKKGFLWFATESGLCRFDGSKFRVYKKNENDKTASISGNELNKVYADKHDDVIWVATQREGLNMFDYKTGRFTHYRHVQGDTLSIITNDITDITNSRDGNLWLSSYYKGVEYFDKRTKTFKHFNKSTLPGFPSDNIWVVREDKSGLLFIGHVADGLTIYSLKDKTLKNFKNNPSDKTSLPGNEVRSICFDENNNVWIGTNNGLALYDRDQENFKVFRNDPSNKMSLASNYVFGIEQMHDGKLWISTEKEGISILDFRKIMFLTPENVKFSNIAYSDDERGLSNPTSRTVFQDSYHNVWIATYGGGVNFMSHYPTAFKIWDYSPVQTGNYTLNNHVAWGITVDSQDRIWVGTDGGGVNIFENGKRQKVLDRKNSPLTDDAVLAAIRDSKNNIWLGTFNGGVNVFDSQQRLVSNFLIDNSNIDIRGFHEDRNGNMWIASSGGLYKRDLSKGNGVLYTRENSDLSNGLVRCVLVDQNEFVWVGFFGGGLSVYDKEFRLIRNFQTRNGFPSNSVDYIYQDRQNKIWVATGEGLVAFEKGRDSLSDFRVYNAQNGYIDTYVRAITEDESGNIWLSSSEGISRLDVSDMKFYNYDRRDGLPLGEFMSGSVTKDSKGRIYFGSQNGLCFFDPKAINGGHVLPAPVVTSFSVFSSKANIANVETDIPVSSNINLDYTQNSFNISFNTLDYALSEVVDYAYMLRGLDNIWYESQGDNSIKFRNIPPGKYELHLKSKLKNQDWSEDFVVMTINIAPPMWLTWWALTIYAVIAALIVFFIFRFYKKKMDLETYLLIEKRDNIQKQTLNEERLRFFTNITHELRTPLTLILGPLEDLQNDVAIPEKQAFKINLVHRSAMRLLNLINQILEFRKTETQNKKLAVSKGDIVSLVHETGLKYKELNVNKRVNVNIQIECETLDLYYDTDVITTILENLLSNAMKYTQKGDIDLILRVVREDDIDYVEIEVRDTGRGIPEESLDKIFERYYQAEIDGKVSGTGIGLALIKNLIDLHQGEIFVKSKVDVGTSFVARIRKDNTYEGALRLDSEKSELEVKENTEIEISDNKPVVLVVEDDVDILEYIQSSLSPLYNVFTAKNGKEGLKEAFARIPDLIVSDIMMPEMDGLEMSRKLKHDVRTSHIPIVLLTAKDSIQDRTEGYDIGVDSYLTKPFSANLLQSRIVNLLEQRRRLAEQINSNAVDKGSIVIESLNKLDEEFMEKVTSIIEENLESDKVDVAFIAESVNMSHSTLYRKIKALAGISVNEFIRKVRIRSAEKFLLSGKYTISEVSYMVGFNSNTYFRQCFKEEFGLTPSDYLKSIMKGK